VRITRKKMFCASGSGKFVASNDGAFNVLSWVPTASERATYAAGAVTFTFEAECNFPSTAAACFSATANGAKLPLDDATVTGTSLVVPFTPTEDVEHTFRLVAFGTEYTFTLDASDFDA
jgi:hypothetical protein